MSLKESFFYFYITQRNRFLRIYSELGIVKGIIEFILIIYLSLNTIKISIPKEIYIIATIILFILIIIAGYFWDKMHLFELEQEWQNKRNPFCEEMRKKEKFK